MLIRMSRQCSVILAWLIVCGCCCSAVQAKIYERCELARELRYAHRVPLQQIATWVCIAQRESLFNTATVGRLNSDGSADHGIFQISDLYWCSHSDYAAKSCGLLCKDLLDNDISNDVSCIKTIYEEHTRLTGDGFNAWTTYQPFCRNQDYKQVSACFDNQPNKNYPQVGPNSIQNPNVASKKYAENPFLKKPPPPAPSYSISHNYQSNPFLNSYRPQTTPSNYNSGQGRQVAPKYNTFPSPKHVHPQKSQTQPPRYNDVHRNVNAIHSNKGKIYTRCSLAQELYTKHSFPMQDIATWVCIAEHQSSFNSAAVGRQNGDGSANYGLFQISDRYWCSDDNDPQEGNACNIPCHKLMDDDLTDDVRCIKTIYDEHTRISGDGFNAWTVYTSRCQNQNIEHIRQCFDSKELQKVETTYLPPVHHEGTAALGKSGKTYQRCELAQELLHKHKLPMEQIPTWVCIAEHESRFQTAAVGRLNTDGSADHGLFQISDLYWCSHDRYGGKACNIACDKFLDSDISDDVRCIKMIHEEHTRISGDGFNAWTVYQPHCRNKGLDQIKQCFSEKELKDSHITHITSNSITPQTSVAAQKGKIYNKCELAQELYHKHRLPMDQIPTWVCIAEHESSYKTSAVGRLNTDGSADHGLFQISDLYWCSHDHYGGKACNIACDKFLDSDISDDVRCIQMIHEEHTRISGDGFNAWTVYKPHCRNKGLDHVKQCFSEKELKDSRTTTTTHITSNSYIPPTSVAAQKGKVYSKCELAQELYHKHRLPMDQIPTWVCIAEHESSYKTSAVGRLNTDGSADHGLFQISDLYWCSHDHYGGKACNIACDKFLDSDISDDVRCIQMIHEEHTRISGDGFNAWTVYKPHCRNTGLDHVKQCFSEKELKDSHTKTTTHITSNSYIPPTSVSAQKGKIYNKCELAQELYHKHRLPMDQIPTWVCIAEHESSYKTSAVGRLNTDGSADHGLFQISDLYWCSHDHYGGKACNIACDKFLDSDISDDVRCIQMIHEEHTRISGDGFNAWTVYKPHCRNKGLDHVKQCFSEKELKDSHTKTTTHITHIASNSYIPPTSVAAQKGKIYNKCELAQELYHKHRIPMNQVPTWVCIAQHESSFNTAAVGRLNTDGSADHGLFQISDLFWCSHDQHGGKACNLPCDKLLDSDISDDVRCIKMIHEEHTGLSGDGFNAWTVYKPHCRNKGMNDIKQCFSQLELAEFDSTTVVPISSNALQPEHPKQPHAKGKIYKKCELAQELLTKHKIPMEQIPTWVCIAQHESSFNTAAVGRLNTDGSADHGLFQISDLYWCTHDHYGGKACNIPCDRLLDSDITDDVKCIKMIHEEHTQLSGDGFNAWTVYMPHCRNRKLDDIRTCFSSNEIELYGSNKILQDFKPHEYKAPQKQVHDYSHNPFLNGPQTPAKPSGSQYDKPSSSQEIPNYSNNPFLQNVKIQPIVPQPPLKVATTPSAPTQSTNAGNYKHNPFLNGAIKTTTSSPHVDGHVTQPQNNFQNNPFLNGAIKTTSSASPQYQDGSVKQPDTSQNYKTNPFLNGAIKISSTSAPHYPRETTAQPQYNNNPFLSGHGHVTTTKPIYNQNPFLSGFNKPATDVTTTKPTYNQNPFLTGVNKPSTSNQYGTPQSKPHLENISETTKYYLDSNNFRTKANQTTLPVTATMTTTAMPGTTTGTAAKQVTKTNYLDSNNFRTKPTLTTEPFPATITTTGLPTTTTTTLKPTTATSRPTTITTTLATTTAKPTTTSPKSITTTKFVIKTTSSTLKPSSTTARPITTTTTKTTTTTTAKPPTTPARPISTRKPATSAAKPPTTPARSITSRKPATTTARPITTRKPATAKPPTTTARSITTRKSVTTTAKPPTTTARSITTRKPVTTTAKPTTTTARPITTRKPTTVKPQNTPARSITTRKSVTTTAKPSTTTARPITTRKPATAKPPTTPARSITTRKPATTPTTSRPRITTTAKKPTTSYIKTTTTTSRRPTITTTRPATTSYKTTNKGQYTTSSSWNNGLYKQVAATTTKKPITTATHKTATRTTTRTTTTTKRPTTTKTRVNDYYKQPTTTRKTTTTTRKPTKINSTTKSSSIWSWNRQPTTTTRSTTRQPITTRSTTTPARPSTSWRITGRPGLTPITSRTTSWNRNSNPTKPTNTWNWNSGQYQQPIKVTTKKPTATTHRTTTTRKPNVKQLTTTTRKYLTTTTKKPPSLVGNYAWQQQKHTTKSPQPLQHQRILTTTTKRPSTTTTHWNWQQPKYSNATFLTTRTPTKLPTTTTKRITKTTIKPQQQQTTWHWRQHEQQHGKTTANWRITKQQSTTKKPTTTSRTTANTQTARHKTTTLRPYFGIEQNSSAFNKNPNDPFKHSFFDRVKQDLDNLRGNATTHSYTQAKATIPQNFKDSRHYQDYLSNSGNAAKPIVSYNYAPASSGRLQTTTTTKRPQRL